MKIRKITIYRRDGGEMKVWTTFECIEDERGMLAAVVLWLQSRLLARPSTLATVEISSYVYTLADPSGLLMTLEEVVRVAGGWGDLPEELDPLNLHDAKPSV